MAIPLALLAPLIPTLVSLIPDIGRLIAGDRGEQVGTVVRAVAGSLDPPTVAAALADPSKAGELVRQIEEIRAQVRMAEIRQEAEALAGALKDTADARATTVALAQAGSSLAWAPAVMSTIIVAGFFACVVLVMVIDKRWDERTTTIINALLGALTISFGQVCNYWLGSSRGSAAKDSRVDAAMAVMHSRRASEPVEVSAATRPSDQPSLPPSGQSVFRRSSSNV